MPAPSAQACRYWTSRRAPATPHSSAADAGADVVASDLTPELFAAGRAAAAERGVEVTWREADAEALPFADSTFDVVMSCVGVMFAPHHQQARMNSCAFAVRRHDRPAQLDARRLHRADVRPNEAVRAATSARCPAAAPVGR